MSAYERLPKHLQHRIRQVHSYVKDHSPQEAQESILAQYVSRINNISAKLLNYLFRNDSFFQEFLKHSSEHGLIQDLENIISANKKGNPYLELSKRLSVKKQGNGLPIPDAINPFRSIARSITYEDGFVEDGVVYRIAVFGHFDQRKQSLIESKLKSENIEVVFFTKDGHGTYPDCDGVAIFRGAPTGFTVPHYSAALSYYESHKVPIKNDTGRIGNAARVAGELIEFRNELHSNGSNGTERLSA